MPVLGVGSAGTFGTPVAYVTIAKDDAPSWVTPLPGDYAPGSDAIRIPRSAVTDLGGWDWYALFAGEWCWVANVREERLLIVTSSYSTAMSNPWEWKGSRNDGWSRWVDADEVVLEARWQPSVDPSEGSAT
ncbi:hypothetical protein [Microbacterium rhizomatis]|uniref:Uncharacterized protein n=1 Tax=Microbacterium rhizomatis TaxID=1631477 RepID=A0A5J5J4P1_9MICO|nr:hypothetical protein [Microbacterium rhizomatis]KAA9108293.1 hypothetical protein F6B43_12930 [Microbacterium rhizomatis]